MRAELRNVPRRSARPLAVSMLLVVLGCAAEEQAPFAPGGGAGAGQGDASTASSPDVQQACNHALDICPNVFAAYGIFEAGQCADSYSCTRRLYSYACRGLLDELLGCMIELEPSTCEACDTATNRVMASCPYPQACIP